MEALRPPVRDRRQKAALKRNASAWTLFVLKALVTAGLVAYLARRIEIGPVLRHIQEIAPGPALLAVLVMFLQLALVSVRWQLVNRLVGAPTRVGQALRLTLIGQFFNQVLPTSVGGDAVRAWLLSREGVPFGRAVTGVLCDRVVALVVLVLIMSFTFFLPVVLPKEVPSIQLLRGLALLALLGLAVLFFFGGILSARLMRYRVTEPVGKLVRDLRTVLYSGATSAGITALAGVVQLLLVAAICLCALGMSIPLEFGAALLVIPTVMLVSMIPISFAGWGVREGAMILGLGVLGIAPADALAISVAFGLLLVIGGLPGGVLWLIGKR